MALIEDARGRKEGSGYSRLFGDEELGYLVSRIQAAVISAGTELERIIKGKVELIADLDEFLQQEIMPEGVLVADKKEVKRCNTLDFAGSEPDFLIFKRRENKQVCHLVELKDGDSFDTKKASAEHRSMHSFISKNAQHLPYVVVAHFCCFNQDDKQQILAGFKNRINSKEAMTGQEFCDLLELNYLAIVQERAQQCAENVRYFLDELLKIPAVKERLGI